MDFLPRELPRGWRLLTKCSDGAGYVHRSGLIVVSNLVRERAGGEAWLHVSCSHQGKTPTLGELQYVKTVFMGAQRTAVQVLPPPVLVPETAVCFHLWASMTGRAFPSFWGR
jgi:hypothetical protein